VNMTNNIALKEFKVPPLDTTVAMTILLAFANDVTKRYDLKNIINFRLLKKFSEKSGLFEEKEYCDKYENLQKALRRFNRNINKHFPNIRMEHIFNQLLAMENVKESIIFITEEESVYIKKSITILIPVLDALEDVVKYIKGKFRKVVNLFTPEVTHIPDEEFSKQFYALEMIATTNDAVKKMLKVF